MTLRFGDLYPRVTYNVIEKCDKCGGKQISVDGDYETEYGGSVELGYYCCENCHPNDYLFGVWEGLQDAIINDQKQEIAHWFNLLMMHKKSFYTLLWEIEENGKIEKS